MWFLFLLSGILLRGAGGTDYDGRGGLDVGTDYDGRCRLDVNTDYGGAAGRFGPAAEAIRTDSGKEASVSHFFRMFWGLEWDTMEAFVRFSPFQGWLDQ